jgi:hypothetical protein
MVITTAHNEEAPIEKTTHSSINFGQIPHKFPTACGGDGLCVPAMCSGLRLKSPAGPDGGNSCPTERAFTSR